MIFCPHLTSPDLTCPLLPSSHSQPCRSSSLSFSLPGSNHHLNPSTVSLFLAVPNDPESPKNEVQGLGEEKVRRWYLCARFYLARVLLKRPDADVDRRRSVTSVTSPSLSLSPSPYQETSSVFCFFLASLQHFLLSVARECQTW